MLSARFTNFGIHIATELINGGVSLSTIRKRLGYKNLQATLRYAEQTDETLIRKYAHGAVSVFLCKMDRDRSINLSTGAYPSLTKGGTG
jgi:hypothetical protein